MIQKVRVLQDEGSHWYVIPESLVGKFNELSDKIEEDEEDYDSQNEFIEIFNKYRTGGDLNNTQLYADL